MDSRDPAPSHIQWHDGLMLGYTPLDAVHEQFVQCVAALQTGSEHELLALVMAVERHAEEHFAQENHWMRTTGFPASECHINEHEAVLRSVREVRALAQQGDVRECRRLADELANWFPAHADYLDSALAHWMCKRSLGGKPIVFRRNLHIRAEGSSES